MKPTIFAAALTLCMAAVPALAAEPVEIDSRLDALAAGWAHANYQVQDKSARATEAAKVAAQADGLAKQNPGRAEPLVWEAIALATEGGAEGGLKGLGHAKAAKALLERAEQMNPKALGDGSVYTSLGSLYAVVPGFPIGFGDAGKARAYLQKALAVNPTGIDPNYFYGDFLMRQGDYAGAVRALERAVAAPPRPGRAVADQGRREEAQVLLARARGKLRG
jgi:tetratricopeptide (TPR) repeat protein